MNTKSVTVPMLDLEAQHRALESELMEAYQRVLHSNRFILGPEVSALEKEMASFVGARHAVGVSSGTDALVVSLMALDIGPGDEVITTAFSFFATAGCIARLGAKPVFVDIDPETFNLDANALKDALTERTKAILPVHLFGQMCDMAKLLELARAHDIAVVEDAAQAVGARAPEGAAGAVGAFGCFSFFPTKNLGALGDGGLVTTQDDALAERVRTLRAHGAKPKYHHERIGGNFRLDALQAALLRVKLPHLDAWNAARAENARSYRLWLEEAQIPAAQLELPTHKVGTHIYHHFVVKCPRRDELRAFLAERGVQTEVYYPSPLHLQPCFDYLGYRRGSMPCAEEAAAHVLALPIYPELGQERQKQVVDAILAFFRSAS